MTREETKKLFQLLAALHPTTPPAMDSTTVAVWQTVLEPWDYEAVRAAAIQRARTTALSPRAPGDLAKDLPGPEKPRRETPVDKKSATWVRAYHDRLREELAKHGLEPFTGKTGAEYLAWKARCEAEGLDLGELVVETEVKR